MIRKIIFFNHRIWVKNRIHQIHGKHDFSCRKFCFYGKYTVKNKKQVKTNKIKLCMRWKSGSNLHGCHVFTVYNCFVICFVHVTEDHRIYSLEHQRTHIWHFRKQKTGDFSLSSLFNGLCVIQPSISSHFGTYSSIYILFEKLYIHNHIKWLFPFGVIHNTSRHYRCHFGSQNLWGV